MGKHVDAFRKAWPKPPDGMAPDVAERVYKELVVRLRMLAAQAKAADLPALDEVQAARKRVVEDLERQASRLERIFGRAVADARAGGKLPSERAYYAQGGRVWRLWNEAVTTMQDIERNAEEMERLRPGLLVWVGRWMSAAGVALAEAARVVVGLVKFSPVVLAIIALLALTGGDE